MYVIELSKKSIGNETEIYLQGIPNLNKISKKIL